MRQTRRWLWVWVAVWVVSGGAAPAQVLTSLYSFTGGSEGSSPQTALLEGGDGCFYGTTLQGGGTNSAGTLYKISTSGSLTTLHAFTGGTDGRQPQAALVLGDDGGFYGTTSYGGASGDNGIVFKMSLSGSLATLYSFTGGSDGKVPMGELLKDGNGNFYGTTDQGGGSGLGTVFVISASGSLATLHSFAGGNEGSYPAGPLFFGQNGAIYGTTGNGGSGGQGTFYQITTSGTLNELYAFTTGASYGAGPGFPARLAQGSGNDFYGTMVLGSTYPTNGIVFNLTASGSFTTLHSFASNEGINPRSLIKAADGNLYGTTSAGGTSGYGTLFRLAPDGTFATLHQFNGADGGAPVGAMVQGSDGNLYGTTSIGGAHGLGTVFRLTLPPAIVGPLLQTGTAGAAFQCQIVAGNHPSGFSAGGLPSGLSLNPSTGWIKGTPKNPGNYSVAISATNQAGTDSATLALVILPPANAPYALQTGQFYSLVDGGKGLLSLNLTRTGKFTASLVESGSTIRFAGSFAPDGTYQGNVGVPPVSASFQLTPLLLTADTGSYRLTGTLGGSSLTAYHATRFLGGTPAEVGRYTLALTATGTDAAIPQGSGFASATVRQNGAVSFVGKLADGTPFSLSDALVGGTSNNRCLVYQPLKYASVTTKGAKGLLSGRVTFNNLTGADCSGVLAWSKPAQTQGFFPASIQTNLVANGSRYTPPSLSSTSALPGFSTGLLSLSDGAALSLSASTALVKTLQLSGANKFSVTNPGTDNLKISLNPSNGSFTGSFVYPHTSKLTSFGGVVLQNGTNGRGFFLSGTGQSGQVSLSGSSGGGAATFHVTISLTSGLITFPNKYSNWNVGGGAGTNFVAYPQGWRVGGGAGTNFIAVPPGWSVGGGAATNFVPVPAGWSVGGGAATNFITLPPGWSTGGGAATNFVALPPGWTAGGGAATNYTALPPGWSIGGGAATNYIGVPPGWVVGGGAATNFIAYPAGQSWSVGGGAGTNYVGLPPGWSVGGGSATNYVAVPPGWLVGGAAATNYVAYPGPNVTTITVKFDDPGWLALFKVLQDSGSYTDDFLADVIMAAFLNIPRSDTPAGGV